MSVYNGKLRNSKDVQKAILNLLKKDLGLRSRVFYNMENTNYATIKRSHLRVEDSREEFGQHIVSDAETNQAPLPIPENHAAEEISTSKAA